MKIVAASPDDSDSNATLVAEMSTTAEIPTRKIPNSRKLTVCAKINSLTCKTDQNSQNNKQKYYIVFQLDASIISCIITLVSTSIFLHINYIFKMVSMILTVIGHLIIFACFLADGVDDTDFSIR